MVSVSSEKKVKIRKEHYCQICNRKIPKGFSAHFYSGITDEHCFFNVYLCNTCDTLSKEFPDSVTDFWEGYFDNETLCESMSKAEANTPLQLLNKLRSR